MTVFGIGYHGHSIADFIALLRANGVTLLLDVREAPWSQRPEYRKRALAQSLENAGITYRHVPEAGNPFRPKRKQLAANDGGLAQFGRHVRDNPQIIDALLAAIAGRSAALMCMCSQRAHCHRSALLLALEQCGSTVIDLPTDAQLTLL